MKQRDFHKHVRIVYRACRKLYGKEKTQDECLKVFKVVFPEIYKLQNSEEENAEIPQKVVDRLSSLAREWDASKRLKELIDNIIGQVQMPFGWKRKELIQFYEDITPVAMRIRKLTPRECLRLMDLSEPDIDKMLNCGLSNSSLYRLAGNSICISPMFHLFRKLFIDTGIDITKGKPQQLTLF